MTQTDFLGLLDALAGQCPVQPSALIEEAERLLAEHQPQPSPARHPTTSSPPAQPALPPVSSTAAQDQAASAAPTEADLDSIDMERLLPADGRTRRHAAKDRHRPPPLA